MDKDLTITVKKVLLDGELKDLTFNIPRDKAIKAAQDLIEAAKDPEEEDINLIAEIPWKHMATECGYIKEIERLRESLGEAREMVKNFKALIGYRMEPEVLNRWQNEAQQFIDRIEKQIDNA